MKEIGIVGMDILKLLLAGKPMSAKDMSDRLTHDHSKIADTLVHLSKQNIVNHIGWAQYVITDLGREQYKRHPRTPHDPSSEERP